MPSAVLLLPFFLIRFGLFALISRSAMKRAAHFAPMVGNAAVAYWVYQATTLGILLCPFFLHIKAYGLGFAGLAPDVRSGYSRIRTGEHQEHRPSGGHHREQQQEQQRRAAEPSSERKGIHHHLTFTSVIYMRENPPKER